MDRPITAISNATRSGVQNQCRPITACRPSGPPIGALAAVANGSVHVGITRSAGVSVAVSESSVEVATEVSESASVKGSEAPKTPPSRSSERSSAGSPVWSSGPVLPGTGRCYGAAPGAVCTT
jgi:hypothetical protein